MQRVGKHAAAIAVGTGQVRSEEVGMSLAAELHAAHKARLSRLGAIPPKSPILVLLPGPVPQPHHPEAGWECMWFYDLIHGHSKEPRAHRVFEIQEAVCRHYGLTMLDMLSQRKTYNITFPRQVAFYLCKQMTKHGFAELGRRFGGKDHTTVIHGYQKIDGLYGFDAKLTCDVNTIKRALA